MSARTLITPANRERRMRDVERDINVTLAGGDVIVIVEQYTPKGTNAQNRLFHDLCDHCARWWNARYPHAQTSPALLKDELKRTYGIIVTEYSPLSGERVARLASWSEYTRRERAALITSTLAWMSENNIPDLPPLTAEESDYPEAQRA